MNNRGQRPAEESLSGVRQAHPGEESGLPQTSSVNTSSIWWHGLPAREKNSKANVRPLLPWP